MTAIFPAIAAQRLQLLDDVLLSTRWTFENEGWTPPARLVPLLEPRVLKLYIDRESALSLQVRFDEAIVTEYEARAQQ
jgi:hypothetical protein